MKTTIDSYVITEEDTSQEEAALKMAASGLVDIHQFWTKIREFKLPLDISPEGKPASCLVRIELTTRTRYTSIFTP